MRILQLNMERGWRGGERQTLLCLRQLRAHGHDVALLARKGGELAERAAQDGFAVYGVSGAAGLCAFLLRNRRGFDILHAQTANTLTWLALLKPRLEGRLVFTRRTAFDVPAKREPRTAWKWWRVDALVAISNAAAKEPRRLGFSVSIIPSAVEAKPLDQERAAAFADRYRLSNKRVLATAAALTSEKDPCTLVRAVHALKQRRSDFVFLHLGAGGDEEAAAHALAKELDLGDHYVFAGFQPDIENLYRLMDVFVLSSRHEALGTSVLDAFLYSVPVAATDAGGLQESLAEGRGLLCPVGDHHALADAMDRLLGDRGLRAALVEKARDYVMREHDAGIMAERYLAVYRQALGGE